MLNWYFVNVYNCLASSILTLNFHLQNKSKHNKYNIIFIRFMSFGFKELLLIVLIVLIVFGAGKLPSVMKEIGKGLKSFRKGYNEKEKDK